MRANIPTILAILLVGILSLCTACVTESSNNQTLQLSNDQTPRQNTSFVQLSEGSPYIGFDEAYQNLRDYIPDPANASTALKTIYYIHGTDLDISGNASSWIFGVRHSNGTALLSYNRGGWIQIPWNASFISEEIDGDRIVAPGRLFSQNNAVILSNHSPANPGRLDLDLIRGVYTLTITSGSTERILMFNATTGTLITQP
jgi:hypothetical protein